MLPSPVFLYHLSEQTVCTPTVVKQYFPLGPALIPVYIGPLRLAVSSVHNDSVRQRQPNFRIRARVKTAQPFPKKPTAFLVACDKILYVLKQAFNIREGRAPYHVIRKRFVNGARLTGSHLCILIIAMLIASIGLDIDSDIAIVGAMLICPLMGSVLAMAYGVATLDREITVEAVASLALQMAFCLVTSTLYFKLSPLGTTTAAIMDGLKEENAYGE